jgi:2,4-dichlorophenol 6-monooxygenase
MLGLQLGFRYETGAVVPDGSAAPVVENPVREYVPTGRPGARLPHAWTGRGDARVSTLDLVRADRFTLIAGAAGKCWIEAAATIASPPLGCIAIGADVADAGCAWARQLGIEADGALLVRPDQHVAWRSPRGVADPRGVLQAALAAILGS